MKNDIFYSDMAVDNLENRGLKDFAVVKNLSYGVRQIVVNVKNKRQAEQIGKPKGVYITYDCSGVRDERYGEYLSRVMANAMVQLVGLLPVKSTVLAVGLGNGQVLADSLGVKVVEGVKANRNNTLEDFKYRLCTHSLGVEGVTGISSHEVLSALNDTIKPSAIIVVDTLATTNVMRLGASFQMSTSGIIPGSGIGQNNPSMNKDAFGVPIISIGVPLVLTMQGVIRDFILAYKESDKAFTFNQFALNSILADKKLSRLVVAPKEVRFFLDNASEIISHAINLAYGI